MGMTIKDALAKANQRLLSKINDAMTKEVFEEVQEEEAATIYAEVYKVYTPRMYRRRGEYGGMGDPYNIEIKGSSAKDGRMTVVNVTKPNPGGCVSDAQVTVGKNLPELIEFGDGYKGYGYDFHSNKRYMAPRPFTAKTIEHLKESRAHVRALRNGLKRQGINVK